MTSSTSISAGSAATSSSRGSATAHQPSAVASSRVAPPAEMRPVSRQVHDRRAARQHGGGIDLDTEKPTDIGGDAAGFGQHRRPTSTSQSSPGPQNCSAVKRQSRT